MTDETTAAPAAPELTPEEQAAADAHAATRAAERGWAGSVEDRLAAIEQHLGLGEHAEATTDETAPEAGKETK